METHRPFSQLQAACSIRFNCQIRGQSQSYLAANLVLTVKSLYQRIMELTWEIFGSSGGPTDTKAALAVRSGAKLKDERQQGGSAPTASAPNQFPSGRNIQPGVYSYSMFNKSVSFWSKYIARWVCSYRMLITPIPFRSKYTARCLCSYSMLIRLISYRSKLAKFNSLWKKRVLTNLDDWLTLVYFQLDAQNSYLFIYIIHLLTLRWLMSYIYGAPILDVSRSHTTTQHSR